MTAGIEAHYSEYWLRATLQEYALQIICSRRRGLADLPWGDRVANHLDRLRSSTHKASDAELLKMLGDIHSFVAAEDRRVAPDLVRVLKGSGQTVPAELAQLAQEARAEAKYRPGSRYQ